MGQIRVNRVGEEIKKELSLLIQRELKDPRIGFATVTGVELSNDLTVAKIYISVFGNERQEKDAIAALTKATGFLRAEIGKKIRLRIVPEFTFKLDKSIAYGNHIEKIISKIHENDADVEGVTPDEPTNPA